MNKTASTRLTIAIVWEGIEAGGVDSYLSYLLNSWHDQDKLVIFYNRQNKGIDRLKKLLEKDNIIFHPVKETIKYFDRSSYISQILKFLIYSITPILFLFGIYKYKKEFKSYDFDVLLAQNGGYPGSYGVLSSTIAAFISGIPYRTLVIHHAANPPAFGHRWFRYLLEKSLNSILTSIISVSQATKITIKENTKFFKGTKKRITIIDNGVPIPDKRKIYEENHIGKLKIGIIGRLEPYKGHDDFLKALTLISPSNLEEISVEFIGEYNSDEHKRLSDLIKDYKLENIVKIIGYIDLPVIDIICNLDLVAMTTKTFEGFGLTIIEALHAGVPVIATRVGIVPELFSDDDCMAIQPGDTKSMAAAIEQFILIDNKEDLISKETRKKLEIYNSDTMAKNYRNHLFDNINS